MWIFGEYFADYVSGNTIVGDDPTLDIYAQGTAEDCMINGGVVRVYSGGVGSLTTLQGGVLNVSGGGVVNSTYVFGKGQINIHSGGRASNTVMSSVLDSANVNAGGYLYYTTLNGGSVYVASGGAVNVFSIENGGVLNASAGATVANVVVGVDCRFTLSSGVTESSTRVLPLGTFYVLPGAVANNLTVYGAEALGMWFGGTAYISSGATLNRAQISGGILFVSSGASVSDVTVYYRGTAYYGAGYTGAEGETVTVSGGTLYLSSGVSLDNVNAYRFYYSSGDTVIQNSGTVFQSNGALVGSMTVSHQAVYNCNGELHDAVVSSGGKLNIGEGALVSNVLVNYGGSFTLNAGGKLTGLVDLMKDGVLSSGRVESHGYGVISGGEINFNISDIRPVSIYPTWGWGAQFANPAATGAYRPYYYIPYYVSIGAYSPEYDYYTDKIPQGHDTKDITYHGFIIAGAEFITGTPDEYTVTVANGGLQAVGTYGLMDKAFTSDDSVTVKTADDTVLGTVTVGGSLSHETIKYTLNRNGSLTVFTLAAVLTVNSVAVSDTTYSVTATFNDYTYLGQYSYDKYSWFDYTASVTLNADSTVYFRAIDRLGNVSKVVGGDVDTINLLSASGPLDEAQFRTARGDFDGNGVSDILFQNLVDPMNPLGAWMDADASQWNGALGPAAKSDWTVYGAYDFTGDGTCDIVFRSRLPETEYAVGFYDMGEGGTFKTMGWGVASEWDLAQVGDFNGNGTADILWHNTETGYHGLWLDGTNEWVALPSSFLGSGQRVFGAGDVNGDGRDEILIDSNGTLGAWNIAGVIAGTDTAPAWSGFGICLTDDWSTVGAADFDDNGIADIVVWNNDSGLVGAYMNCDAGQWAGIFASASRTEWDIPGFGDYDGDGCDDVLVRNLETGALGYWSGGNNFAWNAVGFGVDNSWAVIA